MGRSFISNIPFSFVTHRKLALWLTDSLSFLRLVIFSAPSLSPPFLFLPFFKGKIAFSRLPFNTHLFLAGNLALLSSSLVEGKKVD